MEIDYEIKQEGYSSINEPEKSQNLKKEFCWRDETVKTKGHQTGFCWMDGTTQKIKQLDIFLLDDRWMSLHKR